MLATFTLLICMKRTKQAQQLSQNFHTRMQKAIYFNKFNLVRLRNKTKIQYDCKCVL